MTMEQKIIFVHFQFFDNLVLKNTEIIELPFSHIHVLIKYDMKFNFNINLILIQINGDYGSTIS